MCPPCPRTCVHHLPGPYRVAVNDGVLNLGFTPETKGSPKIANFSIYQAVDPMQLESFLGIGSAAGVVVLSMAKNQPAGILETAIEMVSKPEAQ